MKKHYYAGETVVLYDKYENKQYFNVSLPIIYTGLFSSSIVLLVCFTFDFKNNTKIVELPETVIKPKKQKYLNDFINDMAFSESRHNWKVTNEYGYIGLYQFGGSAIQDLKRHNYDKYKNVNRKLFITYSNDITYLEKFCKRHPKNTKAKQLLASRNKELHNMFSASLQHDAVRDYIKLTRKYLGNIKPYIGTEIEGIKVTESGIIASSHLVGFAAVKSYLKGRINYIPKDGNNVPFTVYLKKFADYNMQDKNI